MDNFSKFDFGDWIYIILVAIGVLSSFFNDKKKKRQQKETGKPKKSFLENLEETIRKMADATEPNEPMNDEKFETIEAKNKMDEEKLIASRKTVANSAKKSTSKMPKIKDSSRDINIQVELETEETSFEFNREELRKSFIFKEIIDKKYF